MSSQPPILLAHGNIWLNHTNVFGFAAYGRALMVATADVFLGDNVLYKNGIGPAGRLPSAGSADAGVRPATSDMLGFVAGRDMWYGDPKFGTFHEGPPSCWRAETSTSCSSTTPATPPRRMAASS